MDHLDFVSSNKHHTDKSIHLMGLRKFYNSTDDKQNSLQDYHFIGIEFSIFLDRIHNGVLFYKELHFLYESESQSYIKHEHEPLLLQYLYYSVVLSNHWSTDLGL